MIFVTVGAQLPFDRLVEAVDRIAPRIKHGIFAQIGKGARKPSHIEFAEVMAPADFGARMQRADVIIGHCGIGTILQAGQLGKPLIVMPRRAALQEHRNDHQVATAKALKAVPGVFVAFDDAELGTLLDDPAILRPFERSAKSPEFDRLMGALRDKIDRA
jgi:UDP-N-acetylglucosamine transferase subunit ALG13